MTMNVRKQNSRTSSMLNGIKVWSNCAYTFKGIFALPCHNKTKPISLEE